MTIDFINGNPVIHFLTIADTNDTDGLNAVSIAYRRALDFARDFGGGESFIIAVMGAELLLIANNKPKIVSKPIITSNILLTFSPNFGPTIIGTKYNETNSKNQSRKKILVRRIRRIRQP